MEGEVITWLIAIPMLGFATGLRTFTPIAVLCWFAWLGQISLDNPWTSWTAKLAAVIVFTVLAAGELIGDKLPRIPDRTTPLPLAARVLFGAFCGAVAADSLNGPALEGIILGSIAAAIGTFVGFMVRRDLVSSTGCPDWIIALAEDAVTIAMAIFAAHIIAD